MNAPRLSADGKQRFGGVLRGVPVSGTMSTLEAAKKACERWGPDHGIDLANVIDSASTSHGDGAGFGAVVITGDEFIPGRYERHYNAQSLMGFFEGTGWRVRDCREGADGGIYIIASPHGE